MIIIQFNIDKNAKFYLFLAILMENSTNVRAFAQWYPSFVEKKSKLSKFSQQFSIISTPWCYLDESMDQNYVNWRPSSRKGRRLSYDICSQSQDGCQFTQFWPIDSSKYNITRIELDLNGLYWIWINKTFKSNWIQNPNELKIISVRSNWIWMDRIVSEQIIIIIITI